MAKKNNYWGLVAVGALTAAAAGAVGGGEMGGEAGRRDPVFRAVPL